MKAGVVAKMVKWWLLLGDCSVVGVVAWLVVVVWGAKLVAVMVIEVWLVQNNDSKRKPYLKGHSPDNTKNSL